LESKEQGWRARNEKERKKRTEEDVEKEQHKEAIRRISKRNKEGEKLRTNKAINKSRSGSV
jgi:hypothetical protein